MGPPTVLVLAAGTGSRFAALLRQAEVLEVPVDDLGCLLDVDTVADLEALRGRP